MSLDLLNKRVQQDLSYLNFGGADWLTPTLHFDEHVYDVVIVGGGQSGLAIAFGLLKERISNILVLDENKEGQEGPWVTYARMVTLRTPKQLTSIDLGVPSLTYRAWWEAQYGEESWEAIDKIPRHDWMDYLRWFRQVLQLPVVNETTLELIEPVEKGLHRLHLTGLGAPSKQVLARKVVLATGIQGGGQWHIPAMITENLPQHLYAHTSQSIDFEHLKGKKIAVLGGGASAFDNANYALTEGVTEAHVFVRRKEMPRINQIRQMELSGMIERFAALEDKDKYEAIAHFFNHNQPPTNDTFNRALAWSGFQLHLGSPWLSVEETTEGAKVTTPKGTYTFDFLIISTGLLTDPALRPELSLVEEHIARWGDKFRAKDEVKNDILDAHPYLSSGFAFLSRTKEGTPKLHGLFSFNYSALISCGITASALSGMKFGVPRIVSAIADQLFIDDRKEILANFYSYDDAEFVGEWKERESLT
ncbi:monooxygenase [Alkalihalobacillus alcalophilus ATCC 27647 = CGMCC 1.3604]|uniref:Monooxygenase n=1 Tax=Alkalihalobacillus alcalophilus ATCC 27647 = CGMCC 1.3604 TaxID=1218173 RepID=A0A094XHD5_ALKAL|nr:NAD(P)/FAD-dependent oxidoreductase [Alkalihalobacillus alcalophilus]KGA98190.1 monooxygenase [Alkalihalobacillus alcalophilus ATCC 27647 = CGMCC 1.3604]MED1560814.1 NAD(P)/FAD-dependent oxidoreductase [Alkalihalobacillus alcalophilus]THG91202.1 monooxygenase [Alkalihalobacillus alcalophilus ATCC 27647 = CGMCC 1.3604]